ncbi:hypothetical protein RBXJA2T_08485 [Rubrivivax benzoatilyticus JA2 = ATCC BAA-35]|nr:hypothetical protein RBXJA2T_08485 [Rubrivivax benzoatilyticus JA2 = ATCC BAA-35]
MASFVAWASMAERPQRVSQNSASTAMRGALPLAFQR